MAAAAYAALVSLLNTMDQIQIHARLSACFEKNQFESLRGKVDFFLEFIEKYSDSVIREKVDFTVENFVGGDLTGAEDLARQITVVAHEAGDAIEVEAADRVRDGSTGKSPSSRSLPNLQKIIRDMDSVKEKVVKVKEEIGFTNSISPPPPSSSSSFPPPATTNTTMLGFDGYVLQLLDKLTSSNSGRRILPIVGMGGIGKTTLTRNLYENSRTVYHFDVRVWVTVSQQFCARDFLLQALSVSKTNKTDEQLGEELYKALSGRRYLIVLDDVWNVEAWEEIRFFFPENNNGSRIVVTTRELILVDYFGSSAFALEFLDDKMSWELFCNKAFLEEGCPSELEQIGKKIVRKCKGLPLAIIVIGGLLGKSPRNQEYWEKIANDRSLVLDSGEGNKPLSILYLSYKYLPVWLKSCFLYFRVFPEDERINVPRLVKLWVAEGFIKPNTIQSLEEVAESYIKDLVHRNLLLVSDLGENKKYGTCYVHDLVRDLCIRIAERDNCLCFQRDMDGARLFIVDERTASLFPQQSHTSERPSIFSPLTFNLKRKMSFKSRLLRVSVCDTRPSDYSLRQVNLRYLSLEVALVELERMSTYKLPSSISLLWSLQTLIIDIIFTVVAPPEIWEMPQLRHINIWYVSLPHPPSNSNAFVLQSLQTLVRVKNLILTEEVCKRIPNIKNFSICYEFLNHGEASPCYDLQNVGCLDKLESLKFSCNGFVYAGTSLQNLTFPSYLKELTLEGCSLDWKMIGSLPHLQILELLENAVIGAEWNCVEEFLCLKQLSIYGCRDLINWIAERSNFPVLETLSLSCLPELEEIPSSIGGIATLERMHIYECSESATNSAIEILEEQVSLGNDVLQLELDFFHEHNAEVWREKIQESGFTCQNIKISGVDNMGITDEELLEMVDLISEIEGLEDITIKDGQNDLRADMGAFKP